ncbi:MAG: GAF domain-containing protein [Candidatus Riflebacteria bacterium]|nr:GAF domain-containing protein [Candidatus Riflebacteria bacterium]
MSDQISRDTMRLLYDAQCFILSHGKETDAILGILSNTAQKLSGCRGFGVFFYDIISKTSRIRFNDGCSESFLKELSDKFAVARSAGLPLQTELVISPNGDNHYFIPIGQPDEPFGVLVISLGSRREISGLEEFREMSANAIAHFMEVEVVKLQMAELATLLEVGKAISSTLDLNELLTKIMHMATQVMRCETSTVYLVDKRTNELYFHLISGDAKVGAKLKEIRLPMGMGLSGWCAKENKPVIVPDAAKDPRLYKLADKKSGFITRSMICVPMRLKDEVVGVLQVLNRMGDIPFNDHDVEILEAVANQAVSALDNARLYDNIQKVYLATVEVLATAIDAKDPYTHGHSRRVTDYSVAIAEELGFDKKAIEDIRYAGLLHDVGKIGITDSIIGKTERLTDEEYTVIKKHPVIGGDILRPVDFLAEKIPGVLHHHEYYDGRGYPHHLTGDTIPLMARIICVSDAFDAMTSDRPYRKGLNVSVAVGELKKFSGKQFDPICVEAFLRAFDKKLFQWFEKAPGSEELILKKDPNEKSEKNHSQELKSSNTPSSQPYPPTNVLEKPKESTQPYPPISSTNSAEEKASEKKDVDSSKPSTQPYPPIANDRKNISEITNSSVPPAGHTPSSQPYPPIDTEGKKND